MDFGRVRPAFTDDFDFAANVEFVEKSIGRIGFGHRAFIRALIAQFHRVRHFRLYSA